MVTHGSLRVNSVICLSSSKEMILPSGLQFWQMQKRSLEKFRLWTCASQILVEHLTTIPLRNLFSAMAKIAVHLPGSFLYLIYICSSSETYNKALRCWSDISGVKAKVNNFSIETRYIYVNVISNYRCDGVISKE